MGLCVGPIRRDVSDPGRFIKGSFDAEAGLLWQGRALGVCVRLGGRGCTLTHLALGACQIL